jgi:DNA-binding transcriptional ArsR family regulator
LAEPARSRILLALTDGRALPAGRLAHEAGVVPSTASGHLGRLVDGGLIAVEQHGRHRYYRLASAEVADILERVAVLAPSVPVRSLRDDTRARALRNARTCYDHLAGRLGVALLAGFISAGLVEGHDGSFRPGVDRLSSRGPDVAYRLTASGTKALSQLGVDLTGCGQRPFIRHCMDWSEQRHHLAGFVGAAVASRFLSLGWVERTDVRRVVRVTPAGEAGLARFGVTPDTYR